MTLNCLTGASLDLEKRCHQKENVFAITYGIASILWYYSLCLKRKKNRHIQSSPGPFVTIIGPPFLDYFTFPPASTPPLPPVCHLHNGCH